MTQLSAEAPRPIDPNQPLAHWRILFAACQKLEVQGETDLGRRLWDANAPYLPPVDLEGWSPLEEQVGEARFLRKWSKLPLRSRKAPREAFRFQRKNAELGGLDESQVIYVIPRLAFLADGIPQCLSGPTPLSLRRIYFPSGSSRGLNLGDAPHELVPFLLRSRPIYTDREKAPLVFVVPGGGGMNNFHHSLVNSLPSLRLYKEIGLECPIVFPLVPESCRVNVEALRDEILVMLEIPADRILPLEQLEKTEFKRGIIPTQSEISEGLVAFYRGVGDRILGPHRPGTRKIFITRRSGRRRLVNLPQIEERFVDAGYEILDFGDLPIIDQIRAIANSSTIAGLFGAALTNLVFAAPGTRIIEIYNHDSNPRLGRPYEKIAKAGGLAHTAILPTRTVNEEQVELHIPLQRLQSAIEESTNETDLRAIS